MWLVCLCRRSRDGRRGWRRSVAQAAACWPSRGCSAPATTRATTCSERRSLRANFLAEEADYFRLKQAATVGAAMTSHDSFASTFEQPWLLLNENAGRKV